MIHGAGVIADRLIEDKTEEQYKQVVSTKIDGVRALLNASRDDDLKLMVLFSSSTGRFGRKGQVDYAVANEMLNKIAQHEQHNRPGCRVLSINWGPWDGGMVTPQLKKIFEREGVSVIPLRAGCEFLINESSGDGPVEVVVLGSKPEDTAREFLESIHEKQNLHVVFERQLNVNDYPVLASHVMNGKAVLPAALIIEWMAHAAMHNNPGLKFKGFDN